MAGRLSGLSSRPWNVQFSTSPKTRPGTLGSLISEHPYTGTEFGPFLSPADSDRNAEGPDVLRLAEIPREEVKQLAE